MDPDWRETGLNYSVTDNEKKFSEFYVTNSTFVGVR